MKIKESVIDNIHRDIKQSSDKQLKEYYDEFANTGESLEVVMGARKFLQWILNNK